MNNNTLMLLSFSSKQIPCIIKGIQHEHPNIHTSLSITLHVPVRSYKSKINIAGMSIEVM